MLTFIAEVLKLWVVVVLVQNEDVQLADPDQGVTRLVCCCYRDSVLSLALAVKFPGRGDHPYKGKDTARCGNVRISRIKQASLAEELLVVSCKWRTKVGECYYSRLYSNIVEC